MDDTNTYSSITALRDRWFAAVSNYLRAFGLLPQPPPPLQDVLEEFVVAGVNYRNLNIFMCRYPEYHRDLADFYIQWRRMGPVTHDSSVPDEDLLPIIHGFILGKKSGGGFAP